MSVDFSIKQTFNDTLHCGASCAFCTFDSIRNICVCSRCLENFALNYDFNCDPCPLNCQECFYGGIIDSYFQDFTLVY